jgi:hypothetical protein
VAYLVNKNGIISETKINKDNVLSQIYLLNTVIDDNEINIIHRLVAIRKLIEHIRKTDEEKFAYSIISSLIHGKEIPDKKIGNEILPMDSMDIDSGNSYIKNRIPIYSYEQVRNENLTRESLIDAFLFNQNDRFGYKDGSGNILIPCIYEAAENFHEDLAVVRKNQKFGFIDKSGKEVIRFQYDYAGNFENGMSIVKQGNKSGIINSSGKVIVPLKYDGVGRFSHGYAMVIQNDRYGFVDLSGKIAIPVQYDMAYGFGPEGLALVNKGGKLDENKNFSGGKCGFIDISGKEVISCKYDWTEPFRNGLARYVMNSKVGCLDASGKELSPAIYEDMGTFNDGMAIVVFNGKFGYIDTTGQEIIKPQFEDAKEFYQGSANVLKDGIWIKINKSGKIVE